MKIGFALIVSDPLFGQIIEIENREHDAAGFCARLGRDENLPHTTLFQGDLNETIAYRQVAESLAGRLGDLESERTLAFTGVSYVSRGWYFLDCQKDSWLKALHADALDACGPFVRLDPNRLSSSSERLSDAERRGIERYGYRYAGEAFRPHITIGRRSGRDAEVLDRLSDDFAQLNLEAPVTAVTVYAMGPNGTHEWTLYRVDL